ncbi:MAG TPA: LysR family transcriptional regulator [Paracoccaceae bacterium]|nr:LysR family transcriptional regulator [Paracoccaceae bacterium]
MESHEIRYFLALSETLNFTRAAEQCNVTQPALTRAIKGLEDKLGGQLLHRERGNTHLTELGRLMKPYFAEMLEKMQEAKRRAQDFVRLNETSLRVGMMCTIGPSKLIDLFGGFTRRYEGVELYLKDGAAGMLEELLAAGELDVAIYCKPEAPSEALHTLELYAERFVVAVGPGHPLARLSEVRVRDLEGHTYLSRVNCEYRDYIREIRQEMGVAIRIGYQSERDDWIQCMVLAGLGFTLIPEYAVTVQGLATRLLVEPEVVRRVNLVTVRGRPYAPAVGAFVHECRRYPWSEKLRGTGRPASVEAAE